MLSTSALASQQKSPYHSRICHEICTSMVESHPCFVFLECNHSRLPCLTCTQVNLSPFTPDSHSKPQIPINQSLEPKLLFVFAIVCSNLRKKKKTKKTNPLRMCLMQPCRDTASPLLPLPVCTEQTSAPPTS